LALNGSFNALRRAESEYLAAYITELSLPDYSMLQWLPSMIAAAAVLVARYTCACTVPELAGLPVWTPTLTHYTHYRATALRPCAIALHDAFARASGSTSRHTLPAIPDKYAQVKYLSVSGIQPPPRLPAAVFIGEAPVIMPGAPPPPLPW
jgi:cyclin A